MERANIKTIVIIILVLLNALLIINLTINSAYSERVSRSELENLSAILSDMNISLKENALPPKVTRSYMLEVRRDQNKEIQVSEKLLGGVQTEELGGGLTRYFSQKGSAVFRQNFEFRIDFNYEPLDYGSAEEFKEELAELLGEVGLSVGDMEASTEEDSVVFSAPQSIEGLPATNLSITIQLFPEGRASVFGRWVFAYGGSADENPSMSAASLVLPFADGAKSRGYDIKAIERVSYVYYLNQSDNGGFELIPACLFETDAGPFCIDSRKFAFIDLPAPAEK